MFFRLLLVLVVMVCAAAVAGAVPPLGAQAPGFAGAVGCDSLGRPLGFPPAALQPAAGRILGRSTPPAMAAATLDPTEPRVAVTCQAVFEDLSNSANPLALPAGHVTFSVEGPALIVEGRGQSYDIACGAAAASCEGEPAAGPAQAGVVGGSGTLTIHVALLPGAVLPPLPARGAIVVHAAYQPTGSGTAASVSSTIDLVQPTYQLALSGDRTVIGSGAGEAVTLTAQLQRQVPSACAAIGTGPFVACQELRPGGDTSGVEPGIVTFTATIGVFPNLEQHIQAGCGEGRGAALPLIVRAVNDGGSYLSSCSSASVRLTPFGLGGDSVVTATFVGASTGAGAADSTTITIAPQAASIALHGGCTLVRVPAGIPPNAPVSLVVESVTPASAVTAIWRPGSDGSAWQAGYLRDSEVPPDFDQVNPGDALSICVDAPASFPLG